MEFYAVIKYDNKIYSWVEWPGVVCNGNCDLYDVCTLMRDRLTEGTPFNLCGTMRKIVGSSTTHRFKEIKDV